MTLGTQEERVTFLRPFVLKGLEGVQPPGTYSVNTRQENTGFFSFLNAKHTSTWIRICQDSGAEGVLRVVSIDPLDLQTALTQDAAPELA
jgi:hypothetical protein